MISHPLGTFPLRGCFMLGVGIGGFFDGIVFHQLLQWHHVVSSWYPPTTLDNLRMNTLWDGIFHSAVYLILVISLFLVWRKMQDEPTFWSGRLVGGALLMGWGAFNLIEGLVDHHLLSVHHVNETVPSGGTAWWDLAFLLWGAAMLGLGWLVWREGDRAHRKQAGILRRAARHGTRF